MRMLVMTVAVVAFLWVGAAERARGQAPAPWQGFANAWIASHAQRVKGKAPKEARKSCEGDLNGDGHADVVVVYGIEGVDGGNDWTQYVTVLTSTQQGYGATLPKEVGAKTVREVGGCTIAGTTVTLDAKTYGPKDPSCCPSVPGKVELTFAKGALVEASAPVPAPSGK